MPPIWSVESDDPNLAAVLERLVDIKKGNTLVRGQGAGVGGTLSCCEAHVMETPCERETYLERAHLGADSSEEVFSEAGGRALSQTQRWSNKLPP